MSGIFNLFGGTNVTSRNQQKIGSTDALGRFSVKTNALGAGGGPLKQGSTPKPKGLSIRPKSELNVCTPSQKTFTLAKGKVNTLDCAMRPSTPRQKEVVSKLQIVREKQLKSLSPTSKSPYFNLTIKQKGTDDLLFRKPVTPKSSEKTRFVYPEPECFPIYTDDHLVPPYSLDSDLEALKKIRKAKCEVQIVPEGFDSDPELPLTPPMSPVLSSKFELPDVSLDLDPPDIPVFSDSDDDW
ncbi:uncharacterized protein LOC107042730 [Diachasma alloeum]|uniref:uncharacterized protein LOC107042730 n=1 Tax=Diachasma alloeum TaxID=454923 RepID=UPI0007381373|nr:uncharacterized protein LOC107042730 [Diachasma alloeum]